MNFWRRGVGLEWIFVIARSLELRALPYALNRPPRAAASFNQLASANSRRPFCFRGRWEIRCSLASSGLGSPAAVAERDRYRDMKLHSLLFGWSDPDQALRVAAGILGKRASGGRTQALGSAARGAKPSRQCIEPGSLNPG
jgi:hypothetical protein